MQLSGHQIRSYGRAGAAFLILAVAGCGFKQAVGIGKNAPDEFAIETNRPLVLPPSYDLRPPEAGAKQPGPSSSARAEQTLYGTGPSGTTAPTSAETPGEADLLKRAGAAAANPGIRDKVDSETSAVTDRGQGMTDRVLEYQPPASTPAAGQAPPATTTPDAGAAPDIGAAPDAGSTAPATPTTGPYGTLSTGGE